MSDSNQQSQIQNAMGLPGTRAFDRLKEQAKFGHQAWMERLQERQAVEAAYAQELLAARDPNQALQLCNRWIAKRLDLLTADSKAFAGFWMDLVVTAAGGGKGPAGSKEQGLGSWIIGESNEFRSSHSR
jgi:hypothetical protein